MPFATTCFLTTSFEKQVWEQTETFEPLSCVPSYEWITSEKQQNEKSLVFYTASLLRVAILKNEDTANRSVL